ncbi:MAG: hypothetical protein U0869_02005 [Chloroflexota bacterium]
MRIWHGELDRAVPVGMGKHLERTTLTAHATFLPGEAHHLLYDRWEEILGEVAQRSCTSQGGPWRCRSRAPVARAGHPAGNGDAPAMVGIAGALLEEEDRPRRRRRAVEICPRGTVCQYVLLNTTLPRCHMRPGLGGLGGWL